jgi:hypothetical protein
VHFRTFEYFGKLAFEQLREPLATVEHGKEPNKSYILAGMWDCEFRLALNLP